MLRLPLATDRVNRPRLAHRRRLAATAAVARAAAAWQRRIGPCTDDIAARRRELAGLVDLVLARGAAAPLRPTLQSAASVPKS